MSKKRMSGIKNKRNLLLIIGFILTSGFVGIFLYHTNKPIFSYNYIEDNFEDQIPGLFPIGWLSGVKPLNIRVVLDDGNNVMEVKGSSSKVTEVVRRFKKTSVGIIECKVKALDVEGRFVVHIPQLDREYDPFDDIMIAFLERGIYVVGEENLIILEEGVAWATDEQSLEDSVPLMNYVINTWYLIKIEFNKERFLLTINGNYLGAFNYPKYNPPYFASLYFVAMATSYNFRFYVDNVKITLSQTVDYIHIGNVALLLVIPISIIGFYILSKRKIKKRK